MVRKSMESRNWMLMKEPKRVSKLWEQVVEGRRVVLVVIQTSHKQDELHLQTSTCSIVISFHYLANLPK